LLQILSVANVHYPSSTRHIGQGGFFDFDWIQVMKSGASPPHWNTPQRHSKTIEIEERRNEVGHMTSTVLYCSDFRVRSYEKLTIGAAGGKAKQNIEKTFQCTRENVSTPGRRWYTLLPRKDHDVPPRSWSRSGCGYEHGQNVR
jgi:hypothetical protein